MAGDSQTATLTKQERVYREIRERILSGSYGPGYRVVIDTLADEFAVSALPVREAVRRLEAEGLVIYRPNAGAQVTPADPSAFDEETTVLAVLEGFATALAAPNLNEAEVQQLDELNEQMVQAIERLDPLGFGRLNQQFHGLIVERCANPTLVQMVRDIGRRLDAIRRTVFLQIPYRSTASVAEHRALVELIRDRAPTETIEAAARAHKLNTVASFREWRREQGG